MRVLDNIQEFREAILKSDGCVGYHSTVESACDRIEEVGFLPDKIFSPEEFDVLIREAIRQGIDTSGIQTWRSMRSVTFTQSLNDAQGHIDRGSAGGQGLTLITNILRGLGDSIPDDVQQIANRIQAIRSNRAVTYAVNLDALGSNLFLDMSTGGEQPFWHYRWDPKRELPAQSEIGPQRILLKLIQLQSGSNN